MASSVRIVVHSNRIPSIVASLRPKASQVVHKTSQDVASRAKQNTVRVDTGAMKNGFQVESRGPLTDVVFNATAHHIFQELGTVHISASPMLIPAAEAARGPFEAAMKQLVSGL